MSGTEYRIEMSSQVYGTEEFHYDSLKDANEGMSRLKKDCLQAYRTDKIQRELRLFKDCGSFQDLV